MLVAALVPPAEPGGSGCVCELPADQDHPGPRTGSSELTLGPEWGSQCGRRPQDISRGPWLTLSVSLFSAAEEETPSPTEMEETPSPTERPEEPILGELTVTGSSPDSLSLSWTVPQGHFDSFTVQYKGRAGPQVVRVGGEESEVTVEGLEAGRKYKMHLYGFHDGQRVGPVSVIGVTRVGPHGRVSLSQVVGDWGSGGPSAGG